jgi:formylglycine-generating enzyme
MKKRGFYYLLAACCLVGTMTSCSNKNAKMNQVGSMNKKTGVKYKDVDGIEEKYKLKFKEKDVAPGLVFIPGGTMMMGASEKDIQYAQDNRTRQITVQSFYIDETEVANVDWKLFLYDIEGSEGAEKIKELHPDTLVWRRDLGFNEPLVENYWQHPAFNMYPVVGVTWHQANEYCKWRTKKVNEQKAEKDENAILYPSYRLPTEAEWEYAARGLQESEVYSWEGKSLRNNKGKFIANFKRGRGDYAGWAGDNGMHWTDNYSVTAPVTEFPPNDFGLYNMSGNVAEWTQDTYRVLGLEDVEDLNPYRRRGKTEYRPDQWLDDFNYTAKNSLLFHPDAKVAGGEVYDNVKVYRGGSWADVAYFLSPGARRYYNADSSSAMIGFRCAMIKVGSPME